MKSIKNMALVSILAISAIGSTLSLEVDQQSLVKIDQILSILKKNEYEKFFTTVATKIPDGINKLLRIKDEASAKISEISSNDLLKNTLRSVIWGGRSSSTAFNQRLLAENRYESAKTLLSVLEDAGQGYVSSENLEYLKNITDMLKPQNYNN